MKEHNCFDCLEKADRIGRAKYSCYVCHKDVSFAWFLYMMAIHELE